MYWSEFDYIDPTDPCWDDVPEVDCSSNSSHTCVSPMDDYASDPEKSGVQSCFHPPARKKQVLVCSFCGWIRPGGETNKLICTCMSSELFFLEDDGPFRWFSSPGKLFCHAPVEDIARRARKLWRFVGPDTDLVFSSDADLRITVSAHGDDVLVCVETNPGPNNGNNKNAPSPASVAAGKLPDKKPAPNKGGGKKGGKNGRKKGGDANAQLLNSLLDGLSKQQADRDKIHALKEELRDLREDKPPPPPKPPSPKETLDSLREQELLNGYVRARTPPSGISGGGESSVDTSVSLTGKRRHFVIGNVTGYHHNPGRFIWMAFFAMLIVAIGLDTMRPLSCDESVFVTKSTTKIWDYRFSTDPPTKNPGAWPRETKQATGQDPYPCKNGQYSDFVLLPHVKRIMDLHIERTGMRIPKQHYERKYEIETEGWCYLHQSNTPYSVHWEEEILDCDTTWGRLNRRFDSVVKIVSHLLFWPLTGVLSNIGPISGVWLLVQAFWTYLLALNAAVAIEMAVLALLMPTWVAIKIFVCLYVVVFGTTSKRLLLIQRLSYSTHKVFVEFFRPAYSELVMFPVRLYKDDGDFAPEFDREEFKQPTRLVQYQVAVHVKHLGFHYYYLDAQNLPAQWRDERRNDLLKKVVINDGLTATVLNRKTLLGDRKFVRDTLSTTLRLLSANPHYHESARYLTKGRSVYRDMALVFGAVVMRSVEEANEHF